MSAIDFRALLKAERVASNKQSVSEPTEARIIQATATQAATQASLPLPQPPSTPLPNSLLFSPTTSPPPLKPSPSSNLSYYPSFLTPAESALILDTLLASNHPWHTLTHAKRRVQSHDASLTPFPPYLDLITTALRPLFPPTHPPNHILINEYTATQGIMAHTDGPFYHPQTCTISIGGAALLRFTPRLASTDIGMHSSEPLHEAVLRTGSLLLFKEEFYMEMLHEIVEKGEEDTVCAGERCFNAVEGEVVERWYRVSFTVRHKFN